MTIRPIEEKDDQAIAQIIKKSLEAVGLDQEGTAYTDPQ
ncbi:MAG: GNAT family N-acetyltransferase, partial [Streptococcus parauberis]